MDRKSRTKILVRAIRATAYHVGADLSDEDIAEILERLTVKGRPRKIVPTDEQERALSLVYELLEEHPASKPHPTYRRVAEVVTIHSESATYHWLRRHFPAYSEHRKFREKLREKHRRK